MASNATTAGNTNNQKSPKTGKSAAAAPAASAAAPQGNSRPFFTQKATLRSFAAQKVFTRSFDIGSTALFSMSVILRSIGTEEQAQEVEKIVDQNLEKGLDDLRSEIARLTTLAENNGVDMAPEYTNSKEVAPQISSPRATRLLAIIREFDTLIAKLDALWLSGVINDKIYAQTAYSWQRNVLRLTGKLRVITTRAVMAARRKEGIKPEELTNVAADEAAAAADAAADAVAHPVVVQAKNPEATPANQAEVVAAA